jgi:osmotically-inducible protein OsmY
MPRTPRTYDEIIARTVPDPDSSFRPTAEARDEALSRVEPPRDEVLGAKVEQALREAGAAHLSFEIEGGRVILRGALADLSTWRRVDAAVSAIDGVGGLDNRTHIG